MTHLLKKASATDLLHRFERVTGAPLPSQAPSIPTRRDLLFAQTEYDSGS